MDFDMIVIGISFPSLMRLKAVSSPSRVAPILVAVVVKPSVLKAVGELGRRTCSSYLTEHRSSWNGLASVQM